MHAALRFAYDGSRFDAYARTPGKATVEAHLIEALQSEGLVERGFRTGSRTDRGVSAFENVCRVTLERPHLRGIVPAVQQGLPPGIWVTGAAPVAADWNPRHGAIRTYAYYLPRDGERLALMRAAAARFLGHHDMTPFARVEPGRDPMRQIDRFTVAAAGDWWLLRVESPGFLWNQVRRMVSAVSAVGRGEAETGAVTVALRGGDRHPAFQVAPAVGLVLERVRYPGLRWASEAGLPPRRRVVAARQVAHVQERMHAHVARLSQLK